MKKIKVISIVMAYQNRMRNNQPLVKIKSSSDKIEQELNELARDYNTTKEMVESQENNRTKQDINILPEQKRKNKK